MFLLTKNEFSSTEVIFSAKKKLCVLAFKFRHCLLNVKIHTAKCVRFCRAINIARILPHLLSISSFSSRTVEWLMLNVKTGEGAGGMEEEGNEAEKQTGIMDVRASMMSR